MIKRNQSSMTLLNNITTNTVHFSDPVHPVQLRADDTRGTDVNFIIVLIEVQSDLHNVNAINWNRNYLQCSQYNV